MRQNKVMQLLIVTTSVSILLTLVTGWYGMNFDHMPELHMCYASFAVIVIAVTLVTVEIVYFKRKKRF